MKLAFTLMGLVLSALPALAYPEDLPSRPVFAEEKQKTDLWWEMPALLPSVEKGSPNNRRSSLVGSVIPKGCRVPDWAMAEVVKQVPSLNPTQPLRLLVQPKTDPELNQAYVPVALAVDGETWYCTEARIKAFVRAMTALPVGYIGEYGGYSPNYRGTVYVRGHTRCNANKCWPVRSYWRRR